MLLEISGTWRRQRRERKDVSFSFVGEQNAYQGNDLVVREDSFAALSAMVGDRVPKLTQVLSLFF